MRPAFTKDPLFKKGLRIRKALLGAQYIEGRLNQADEYSWPFEELATKTAWGMIWTRPGLPRKVRRSTQIHTDDSIIERPRRREHPITFHVSRFTFHVSRKFRRPSAFIGGNKTQREW